ncbi:MAG: GatB/YqeY domain-containing protein [Anaerolineales bacterium]|nr:GatB/YqeY domain-containing protein [Anaerolineales bacterium]MCB9126496.1 GatB/YqeY domain-containing protein [Ardenticatenales bacterium]
MSIHDELNQALKAAMRERNTGRRDTIRLLMTTLKNAEIEKGEALTAPEWQAQLQKQAKQRRDSIAAYDEAGRSDLADGERAELAIIESYLPEMMSDDEIGAAVDAQIAAVGANGLSDIGRVMGPLMSKLRGKADGAAVQRIVRERLG